MMIGDQGKKPYGLKSICELSRRFVFRILSICTRRIASDGSSVNWTSLPDDVLDFILHKLVRLIDYVRFGAVCKSWYFALRQKQLRCITNTNQIPLLLVPPCLCHPSSKWTLSNIIFHKNCNLKLLFTYPCKRICGSSYGWLATMDSGQRLILINPFSSTSNGLTAICLPLFPLKDMNADHVKKVILSCDPSLHPHDYMVVASFTHHHKPHMLAYIKPTRDKSWTLVETQSISTFLDIYYYKNHIHGLGILGELEAFYVEDVNKPIRTLIVKPRSMDTMPTGGYIVKASDGGLLMVQQWGYASKSSVPGFSIYRLRAFEWVEIDGLGGDALFLGDNSGVCVEASNYPGCQPNCIYFIAKFFTVNMKRMVSVDAGIYNSHDKSCRFIHTKPARWWSSGIWILPKLQ